MNFTTLIDSLAPTGWATMALVTTRVIGVMMLAPMWSMSSMPRQVRVALALAVSFALLPFAPQAAVPDDIWALPMLVGVELLIGIVIGLTAALFLYAVAVAGEVVSVQMGLAIATALAPGLEFASPGVGSLKNLMALALYFTLGGHLLLIGGIAESLHVVPPGGAIDTVNLGLGMTEVAGTVFVTAVKIAAPLLAAMMLANGILAILSKAVPQINTLMVAFPVTIGLGFIVLGASLPFLNVLIEGWVFSLPDDIARSVNFLVPQPVGP